ncbi:hypothetical protein D3C72_1409240 [compost metagenome]
MKQVAIPCLARLAITRLGGLRTKSQLIGKLDSIPILIFTQVRLRAFPFTLKEPIIYLSLVALTATSEQRIPITLMTQ